MTPMDDAHRKRKQLEYRRKITILKADLMKAQKEQQSLAMEMRRLERKRWQIDVQLDEMKKRAKKVDNEVRMLHNDLKMANKGLNRIS